MEDAGDLESPAAWLGVRISYGVLFNLFHAGSSLVGDIKTINKFRVLKFKFTVYKSTDYSGLEYTGYAD